MHCIDKVQALEEIATKSRLKIRVLTPFDDSIKELVEDLTKYADVRYIPEELQTKITIVVVDRKSSLIVEVKDDSKDSSYGAMGLGTFSNSPLEMDKKTPHICKGVQKQNTIQVVKELPQTGRNGSMS